MFKTIVAGTDDSPTARKAIEKAVALAKSFDATLHLVTGFHIGAVLAGPDPELAGTASAVAEEVTALGKQAQGMLDSAADTIRRTDVKVETHAVPGAGAEAILEVAERTKADLIVVGSRGMTGARRFLLGSVPNRVSHHAPCDVLIVHTG